MPRPWPLAPGQDSTEKLRVDIKAFDFCQNGNQTCGSARGAEQSKAPFQPLLEDAMPNHPFSNDSASAYKIMLFNTALRAAMPIDGQIGTRLDFYAFLLKKRKRILFLPLSPILINKKNLISNLSCWLPKNGHASNLSHIFEVKIWIRDLE